MLGHIGAECEYNGMAWRCSYVTLFLMSNITGKDAITEIGYLLKLWPTFRKKLDSLHTEATRNSTTLKWINFPAF